MLETVFVRFLEISATTGIIILGLRLLAPYLNKTYAAKWKYWIWLVLAIRLIIPVNISLPTTPVEVNIPYTPIITSDNMLPNVPAADIEAAQPDATAVQLEQTLPLTETAQRTITLLDVIAVIWLIGIFAFLAYQIAGYFIFKRTALRWSGVPQDPRIESTIRSESSQLGLSKRVYPLISDAVSSPLMVGFFRPLLILPRETYSDTDLSLIVRHELTHCRRNDLWYKLLLLIASSVHWFNPAIHLMFHEAGGDLELSCDDVVTNGMSFGERKVYTDIILASIQRQRMKKTALSTYFYGGKRTMKNRFINILNTKRKKSGALVLLIVVLAGGALGALVGCTAGKAEPSAANTAATSAEGTGPFVGYVKDAAIDTLDVYTEKDGTYIMSLPWSLFSQFPASDRTASNWQPGWMDINIYCGSINDFAWAVVCTGPSAGTGNANVCTSKDGGKTWWVGDKNAMYTGTVTGAGFASSEVGFMSYRYYSDQGPEISRTLDGGKTWARMTVDIPDNLKKYKMTPLVPTFTGKSGSYPIELYDSGANYIALAYLTTEDGGMTWQWTEKAEASPTPTALSQKEQLTNYLTDIFNTEYTKYYDGLHYEMTNYSESISGNKYTATFNWTEYFKNYYKDPDTVGYIKKAKESGDKDYQGLYDDYNAEHSGNFSLKATAVISSDGTLDLDTIEILGDSAMTGAPKYDEPLRNYFPESR